MASQHDLDDGWANLGVDAVERFLWKDAQEIPGDVQGLENRAGLV